MLSLILILRQQFIECNFIECNSVEHIKELNIKLTYYFFDMMNIKDFDPNLLKLDKKSYKISILITLDMSQ